MRAGVVDRIDKNTSGQLVGAKKRQAHPRLHQQLLHHQHPGR